MNEVLKKLLESELLTDESRKELEDAFATSINEAIAAAVEEARNDTIAQTKVELHEQYAQQKELLIDAVEAKVNDYLLAEITQLKEDIKRFRDLEAEKAVELAKEKASLRERLKADMSTLVEKIDRFLEVKVASEFEELRSDIMEARKANFGMKVFESFLPEYRKYFVDATATERELTEANVKLDMLNKKYKNVKKEKEGLFRKIKLENVLAPLTGSQKDLMESILSSVPTERLEESYKLYIKRVIKETAAPVSKKTKIVEHIEPKFDDEQTFIVTGDKDEIIVENYDPEKAAVDQMKLSMMRLAGIGSS